MSIQPMRIGVGIPIANAHFDYATKGVCAFNALYDPTINADILDISTSNRYPNRQLNQIIRPGDRIKVGPSTHSNNPGSEDVAIVETVSANQINITTSSLDFYYSANDKIRYVGTNLADGWYPSAYTNNVTFNGIGDFEGEGENSRRGQNLTCPMLGSTTTDTLFFNVPDGSFKREETYHVGISHQFNVAGRDWRAGITVGGIGYAAIVETTVVESSFLASEGDVTLGVFSSRLTQKVFFGPQGTGNGGYGGILGAIWCERMPISGAGTSYYQMAVPPDLGSLKYFRVQSNELKTYLSGGKVSYDYSGTEGFHQRYNIQAAFSNVSDDFLTIMRELETFCRRGYQLTLRPYIVGLPRVLYGRMAIRDIKHDTLDLSLASFSMEFWTD